MINIHFFHPDLCEVLLFICQQGPPLSVTDVAVATKGESWVANNSG